MNKAATQEVANVTPTTGEPSRATGGASAGPGADSPVADRNPIVLFGEQPIRGAAVRLNTFARGTVLLVFDAGSVQTSHRLSRGETRALRDLLNDSLAATEPSS